ncbi:MAG: SUMF1/EgtB/PvdO family nonheme iron enzyme [Verrucomicrobiota bacterium]
MASAGREFTGGGIDMIESFRISRLSIRTYSAKRCLRGGSWINNARNCRSAYRNANDPGNRNDNIGFRLAVAHAGDESLPDPVLVTPCIAEGCWSLWGLVGRWFYLLRRSSQAHHLFRTKGFLDAA